MHCCCCCRVLYLRADRDGPRYEGSKPPRGRQFGLTFSRCLTILCTVVSMTMYEGVVCSDVCRVLKIWLSFVFNRQPGHPAQCTLRNEVVRIAQHLRTCMLCVVDLDDGRGIFVRRSCLIKMYQFIHVSMYHSTPTSTVSGRGGGTQRRALCTACRER